MAAYAALVSLMHIIDQIEHHPHPPVYLDQKQVESLTKNTTFLQEFLEGYSLHVGYSTEADALESRIVSAAHAAEDIIEVQIVNRIFFGSTIYWKVISFIIFIKSLWKSESSSFNHGLQKVIEDMDDLSKEVMEIKEKLHGNPSTSSSAFTSSSTEKSSMVGFDDLLIEIMDKLVGGQPDRQIIPLVGMGGIGKTTLASKTFSNPLIVHHFDILVWVTISQEYDVREFLLKALLCLNTTEKSEKLSEKGKDELGNTLHKHLFGRRYLIVLDDIWSADVWENVKFFFPDNNNGSRIIVTTRLDNLAFLFTGSHGVNIKFLNEDESWDLLRKTVFGEEDCPLEFKAIGRKIARNCKGLPLSIVVIGGLAKSKRTRQHWEFIANNLNSIVGLEDNERCFKILHTSYNRLPVHLKPCFLYTGVFQVGHVIRVSMLIKLWVAEGFLKPMSNKSLEVVARENLKDLIDRNLVLVHQLGSCGKIKFCRIHDLLRDLCLKEAQKEKFLCVTEPHSYNIPEGIDKQRRIVINESTSPLVLGALLSASLARSLICDRGVLAWLLPPLLRVLKSGNDTAFEVGYSEAAIFDLVNLRYLASAPELFIRFPSSIQTFWNLQTLVVRNIIDVVAPSEFWKMSQLRHVMVNILHLPDPPSCRSDRENDVVLGNLQTLRKIVGFRCSEEVVKRIPNVKKLKIFYRTYNFKAEMYLPRFCLNNIGRLQKLHSLSCVFTLPTSPTRSGNLEGLTFPHSLKKLSLAGCQLHWEDMTTNVGSLPLLEVLKLGWRSGIGPEWETTEGKFCSLKFLLMDGFHDLEYWRTNRDHFPRLERLVLRHLPKLEEIPLDIGNVPTLESIDLELCSDSAVISAKNILEEQEELENSGLQIRVRLFKKNENNESLKSLASSNFYVRVG